MEDVSVRIHSGRALLDAPGAWSSGQVRNPAEVAASAQPGQPGQLRGWVEKAPTDRCLGSIPYTYRDSSDSGRPPDAGSDEPETNIDTPINEPVELPDGSLIPKYPVNNTELPFDEVKDQETREQMRAVNPTVSLIKHNQVKQLALELMAERFSFNGQPKFTRVSPAFCEALERFLYAAINAAIQKHPSTGKTIQDF